MQKKIFHKILKLLRVQKREFNLFFSKLSATPEKNDADPDSSTPVESSSHIEQPPPRPLHVPVMLNECLQFLIDDKQCSNFKYYLDMTFGAGGHTQAILNRNPNSIVYALDRDPSAFELAKILASKYPGRLFALNGKFTDIVERLKEANVRENSIDAALIDCGASSIQFDMAERGFSVSKDGPLDMRMGCNNEQVKAEDVVNKLDEDSLGRILWKYGEERLYKKIAHGIVYFRNDHGPIKTTQQLAEIIATVVKQNRIDSISRPTHAATKTFQALRIFVNNELNELFNGISLVHKYLKPNTGRLAVLTFHSLEDRIVKSHFNDVSLLSSSDDTSAVEMTTSRQKLKLMEKEASRRNKFSLNRIMNVDGFERDVRKLWTPLNKKVILPTDDEIHANPRSRSAKLRVAVKNS